ncbi:MAG: short-chain dehydrogenase/reductase [Frankiales bacterium]|nr:short-chain dehydrogenase/reductase [Frankiales bacterium]
MGTLSSSSWATERSFIVTGASSGMGASTARLLGEAGADVVLQGRDGGRLDAVASQVAAAGGTPLVVAHDLADAAGAAQVVSAAVERFGRLDGLVLNASLFEPVPFGETTLQSLDRQWAVNVSSHFVIAQAAVPHLEPGSGIVFVSSTTAHAGFAGCAAYAATKGAVEALARTLAVELADRKIRVNTVAPGFVRTPMLEPHLAAIEGYEDSLVEQTPSARLGHPDEIAEIVSFLLSGRATYVNGAVVVADGGWTAR